MREYVRTYFFYQHCFAANISDNKDKNTSGDTSGVGDPKLLMEALIGEMRRAMRVEMEQVHERMNRIENAHMGQPQIAPNVRRRERF